MITNGKNGNGGRPKIDIDYKAVEKLAVLQCTEAEIAEYLGVSIRTLQRNKEFCRIYKKGQKDGHSSLRRLQWKVANGDFLTKRITYTNKDGSTREDEIFASPNPTMLIWLGKQYLDQKDKTEIANPEGESFRVDISDEKLAQIISSGGSRGAAKEKAGS